MKSLRLFLENWIFGLLGWEEETHRTVRKLVERLVNDGEVKVASTFTDYEEGERYYFNLEVRKCPVNDVPVTVNADGIVGRLIKEFDNCSYDGKCDYKK